MRSDGKLGRMMKSQRKRLDMNLGDMAKALGVSESHLKAIEEGERKASYNVVDKLMRFYKSKGVSIERVFNLWEG